jgi:hypothetical protein
MKCSTQSAGPGNPQGAWLPTSECECKQHCAGWITGLQCCSVAPKVIRLVSISKISVTSGATTSRNIHHSCSLFFTLFSLILLVSSAHWTRPLSSDRFSTLKNVAAGLCETLVTAQQITLLRQHSWLRHYATRRKVAGSNPDGVTGFFNRPNSSSRTITLRST